MENERTPTGKEFHINCFERLVNVATEENISDLVMDLAQWLLVTIDVSKTLREGKTLTASQKKLSNWELLKPTFIWKDDGKNDFTKVVMTNKATGEKTIIQGKVGNKNEPQ